MMKLKEIVSFEEQIVLRGKYPYNMYMFLHQIQANVLATLQIVFGDSITTLH